VTVVIEVGMGTAKHVPEFDLTPWPFTHGCRIVVVFVGSIMGSVTGGCCRRCVVLACGSGQSALVLGATFGGGWAGGGVQAGCGVDRWALLAYASTLQLGLCSATLANGLCQVCCCSVRFACWELERWLLEDDQMPCASPPTQ
jgi:hypothetical protein